MQLLSVDLGSSYVKAAIGGRHVRFASAASEVLAGSACDLEVDGRRWLLGQAALDANPACDDLPYGESAYHGSEVQKVLLCHAAHLLGITHLDTLVFNLPYALRPRAKELKKAFAAWTPITYRTGKGETTRLHYGEVRLTPQGSGALAGYIAKHGHSEGCQMACVVDIGGNSTDIVTVRPALVYAQSQEVCAASGSLPINVAWFWRDLIERISQQTARRVNCTHLPFFPVMQAIERGQTTLRFGKERLDITAPLKQTRQAFTKTIIASAQEAVGARWNMLDIILMTGGGAKLLDVSSLRDPRVAISDSLANVMGEMFYVSSPQPALQALAPKGDVALPSAQRVHKIMVETEAAPLATGVETSFARNKKPGNPLAMGTQDDHIPLAPLADDDVQLRRNTKGEPL